MIEAMAEKLTVTGSGGRALEVEVHGPDGGPVVLFHTGTPSAGTLWSGHPRAGAERGLRHVGYSRPGYAGSERHEGRTVADCVRDVEAIADALGVERFYTVGWSGGGPHALACAALLPGRVIAAATLASVAPYDARGLDWLAGMGEENLQEFAAARAGEEQLLAFLRAAIDAVREGGPEGIVQSFGDLLSDVDRAVLTGEFAQYLAGAMGAGVEDGPWGWYDDDIACLRDWGFDVGAIERPVTVWQGAQDRFVPFSHGEWLAANVAGARSGLRPAEGHLSIVLGCYGEVLDDLLAAG